MNLPACVYMVFIEREVFHDDRTEKYERLISVTLRYSNFFLLYAFSTELVLPDIYSLIGNFRRCLGNR